MTDLLKIKNEYYDLVSNRVSGGKYKQILVCGGSGCTSNHSKDILNRFKELCKDMKDIHIVSPGCFGLCAMGPSAIIFPEQAFYHNLTVEKVDQIFENHIKNGKIDIENCYNVKDGKLVDLYDMPFFKKQRRIVLHNCGLTAPGKIEEYIARDGYFALQKVLGNDSRASYRRG